MIELSKEQAVKAVKRELREIEKSADPCAMALISTMDDSPVIRAAGNVWFSKNAI
jgi:hypothetical protein